jgi:hypothetical protein
MLQNPSLALPLYIATIVIAVMFSPRWGRFIEAVRTAKTVGKEKAAGSAGETGGTQQ